jgi:hypothetical protein
MIPFGPKPNESDEHANNRTSEPTILGADLHGNNVFLASCDGQGKRVMQWRVKANLVAVNRALEPY